jgi:prepilin-type N-terminal cleavage/methylation domain-containing protein
MTRHRLHTRRGLSLIELMVTIVILAIGLVAVSTMFVFGYQSQLNAHYQILATAEANRILEQMRSAGYNHIDSTTFPSPFTVTSVPQGTGDITIAPFPAPTSPNMYKITVRVNWAGGRNVQGATRVTTLISNRP